MNNAIGNETNDIEFNQAKPNTTRFALVFNSVTDSLKITEGIDMGLAILAFEQELVVILSNISVKLAACASAEKKPAFPALAALIRHGASAFLVEQDAWQQANPDSELMAGAVFVAKAELENHLQKCDVILHF